MLAFLLLVGTTNAVNLTDGLDGLVSFVSLPVTMVFAFIAYMQGMLDLSGFSLGLTGACLGFCCLTVILPEYLWVIPVPWLWAVLLPL